MNQRRSPEEIVRGLQTTADKIRALANAGYDRTEIAKFLNIRYQHVRDVLVRSGLAGGLRREVEAEREPVEVDAAPAPREDTSWKVLTDAGFQFLGEWTHDPESLLQLDAKAPRRAKGLRFCCRRYRCLCRVDAKRPQDSPGPVSSWP